jgi:hypothetical protein
MNPEALFSVCNTTALAGWCVLIFLPRQRTARLISGLVIPLVLAAIYITVIAFAWGGSSGGFSSLAAVAELFSNKWLLLAGWVHYLAFDLWIGAWEVRDASDRRVPHLLVVPCLLLTFLFGPAGLLTYHVVRLIYRRSAQPEPQGRHG